MEKPLVTVISRVGWSLKGSPGQSKQCQPSWWSLNMTTACQLCGYVWGGFRKRTMASACLSIWDKAVPQLLSLCQTLHFLPVCHWCLWSCYPGSGAQSKRVWVNLCVGSSRRTAWDSRSFFHQLNLHWCLQPEVMGTYLPGTGILGWGPGMGLGLLAPELSFLNFYPLCMDVGPAHSAFLPLLPVWMDVVSLIPY